MKTNRRKVIFVKRNHVLINVEGELLLGGAYSDSVFRSNSDFSDLHTSIKDVFNVINRYLQLQVQFRRQRHYQLK